MAGKAMVGILGALLLGGLVILPRRGSDDVLSVSPASLDFGQVGIFDRPEKEIVIANHGDASMRISMSADCSCTKLTESLFVLAPQEERRVSVIMRRSGAGLLADNIRTVNQSVSITASHNGMVSRHRADLTVRFEEPLVIDQEACHLDAEAFSPSTHRIGLSANSEIKSVQLQSTPEFFGNAQIEWNGDFNAGYLIFECPPQTFVGAKDGRCILKVDVVDSAVSKGLRSWDVELPVSLAVKAPCEVTPHVLSFEPSKDTASELHVKAVKENPDLADFRVSRIVSVPDGIRAVITGQDRRAVLVSLDADAQGEMGDLEPLQLEITAYSINGASLEFVRSIPLIVWEEGDF